MSKILEEKKKNRVVSLFSGGGGLDLGFKQVDCYEIIWAMDIEPNAVSSYKKNVGEHIHLGDINDFYHAKESKEGSIPGCDVIIGGPPCQSFSLSGNRNTTDARGQLVWTYLDIIRRYQPRAFLFENVSGLLSAKDDDGNSIYKNLVEQFEALGYNVSAKLINAADYGVPQLRKRVIVVGLSKGKFDFPLPTHSKDGGNGLEKYVSVYEALHDLPKPGEADFPTDHEMPQMSDLDKFIVSHVKPGGNYMDIPDDVPSKRIRRLKRDGGHTTCYGRMHPNKPSYTINTYFNRPNVGCNIHYEQDRLITIREAMRLQTFPDSYELVSTSKKGKHDIVGNAVPVLLSKVLAEKLLEYL